jgi:hypothetical protein
MKVAHFKFIGEKVDGKSLLLIYISVAYVLAQVYHVFNWFFLSKPSYLEFIWNFSGRNHLKINISHILSPNVTK